LDRIVERMGDLPAVPAVVSDALLLTQDPDSSMDDVAKVIERDPGLTARILRVSNSPYFGMRQHVGSLKLAAVILGVREIRNIVLGVSLVDALRDPATDRILTDRFWRDSFRVASLSKLLGEVHSLKCQGEDFIAGLLHGIGKMALCRHMQQDYSRLLSETANDDDLAEHERAEFGFSHADVAAALGTRWNLPEPIRDALWLHIPHPERCLSEAKDPCLAANVRIAYYAGRNLEAGLPAAVDAALGQAEAWEAIEGAGAAVPAAERHETLSNLLNTAMENPSPDFT